MQTIELTPDEVRLIESARAQAACSTRPVDKVATLRQILYAMWVLANLGRNLDTVDDLWPKLLELIPDTAP